jgi:hypothetical protein
MVHFQNQHDAPPAPVALGEDDRGVLVALHGKVDLMVTYLDKLHDQIAALHEKLDAVVKTSKAVLKEVKD